MDREVVKEAEIEKPAEKLEEMHVKEICLNYKCDQCEYTNSTEKGLSQHARMKHRISQLDGNTDISEDTDTRNETQPLANSTINTSENVKSKEDKSVQTESDIELVIEGEVCENCEEELIGETLWRIPYGFYLDRWHTQTIRRSHVEGCNVSWSGEIFIKKTHKVIGTVVNNLTHTLY